MNTQKEKLRIPYPILGIIVVVVVIGAIVPKPAQKPGIIATSPGSAQHASAASLVKLQRIVKVARGRRGQTGRKNMATYNCIANVYQAVTAGTWNFYGWNIFSNGVNYNSITNAGGITITGIPSSATVGTAGQTSSVSPQSFYVIVNDPNGVLVGGWTGTNAIIDFSAFGVFQVNYTISIAPSSSSSTTTTTTAAPSTTTTTAAPSTTTTTTTTPAPVALVLTGAPSGQAVQLNWFLT